MLLLTIPTNQRGRRHLACAGVTRDLRAATDLYMFAAEGGHAPAQNNLGRLLLANTGREPADTGRALVWLQAAAEQGSTAAWFNMGMCFEWGVGECAVDIDSAQECYWHAAQQGYQAALLRLEQLRSSCMQQQVTNKRASAALGSTGTSLAHATAVLATIALQLLMLVAPCPCSRRRLQ
ncbi:hypothetical protein COO60DRAFT_1269421 [Scenedesmus sp. NREL 46B-D3]|nr:hypothetical protein COO60DRAFT_1269421 [Scenedesmus sp. NREL 46B-D3]